MALAGTLSKARSPSDKLLSESQVAIHRVVSHAAYDTEFGIFDLGIVDPVVSSGYPMVTRGWLSLFPSTGYLQIG